MIASHEVHFSSTPLRVYTGRPSVPDSHLGISLLDTRKHLHIFPVSKINQPLRERLILTLQEIGRSQEAWDVTECGSSYRVLKASSCNQYAVLPFTCGHRLCQICAKRRSGRFYKRLKGMFDAMIEPKMLTLTVRNVPAINKAYFKWIRDCFSKLRRRKFFTNQVTGGVYSIETTYNAERKDWHVHIHALIDSEANIPRDSIKEAWEKITVGSWGVDIRRANHNAIYEVLKYETKVADFVQYPQRVQEYLEAVKGSRLFHAFGNFFDNEEKEDEEVQEKALKCDCGRCKWEFYSKLDKGGSFFEDDGTMWSWSTIRTLCENTS